MSWLEKKVLLVISLDLELLGSAATVHGQAKHCNGSTVRKLFVFGDSFVDTGNLGNLGRSFTAAWYTPYGITFPGRATGRYSDGRLLTDFLASFMGNKSPVPYKNRKIGSKLFPYGMNFAVAGSGVFNNGNLQRNLSRQIDTFEGQISEGVFSECDLSSSVALVAIDGNDYASYLNNGGPTEGIFEFMDRLIAQLKLDLKRLHDIGVRKMMVNNLHPVGCMPVVTRKYNYSQCDALYNSQAEQHNVKLEAAVEELAGATRDAKFLNLDLYTAFKSIIDQENGGRRFGDTLKPCCEGKGNNTGCGQQDSQGVIQYSLCPRREDCFYWDNFHPTQAAWASIFELLRPSLYSFLM